MVNLVNKIISLSTHTTCIRLCDKEWEAFDEICLTEHLKRKNLIERIKSVKTNEIGLTPAIRLFIMLYYKRTYENICSSCPKSSVEQIIAELS